MTASSARHRMRRSKAGKSSLGLTTTKYASRCVACRRWIRPAASFGNAHVDYVVPDVIARKQAGKWGVILNSAVVPAVRINEVYQC